MTDLSQNLSKNSEYFNSNNHNSQRSLEKETLSKQRVKSSSNLLENHSINPAIIIPKENLNNFFSRLASVSILHEIKSKNLESISPNTNNNLNNILNNSHLNNLNKCKDNSALLDAKFNFNEILNDQDHLLLTEDNILDSHNISREEELLNFNSNQDKNNENFNNTQVINNLSFSIDEHIEMNDNLIDAIDTTKLKNELKLSSEFDTFNKNKKINLTYRSKSNNAKVESKNSNVNKKINLPIKMNNKIESKSPVLKNLNNPINKVNKHKKSESLHIPNRNLETSTNATTKSTLNSSMRIGNNILNSNKNKIISKSPISNKKVTPFNLKSSINSIKNNVTPQNNNLKIKPKIPIISKIPITNSYAFKSKLNQLTQMNQSNSKLNKLNTSNILKTNTNILKTNSNKETNNHKRTLSKNNQNLKINNNILNNEINVIEEYDYSKILSELRAIFGDELEFFDENMLFSNLDELSNKGLIKGLIKLSHMQDKKIKNNETLINKIKSQFRYELIQKDKIIKNLNEELNSMKFSLKGLINEPLETENSIVMNSNRNSLNNFGSLSKKNSLKFKTLDK